MTSQLCHDSNCLSMIRSDSYWKERCYKCRKGGEVLCCNGCRNVAHLRCSTVPRVPDGEWYCDICKPPRHPPHPPQLQAQHQVQAPHPLQHQPQLQQPPAVLLPHPQPPPPPKRLRVLELFKGTGSLSSYCAAYPTQYRVTSLDISSDFEATETCDIREWNYGKYPRNHFDIIFASPPCEEYSMLKTRGERKIEEANEIVLCTLEIIDYFKPKVWFIENPATGLLPQQSFMQGLPYYDVDYCKYSNFGYRKRTRIWTNLEGFKPLKCNRDCGYIKDNKHINTFGGSSSSNLSLHDRIRVPQMLLHKLMWMSYRQIMGKPHIATRN
jgi:hypothetical protein